jgi:hypothetical protein
MGLSDRVIERSREIMRSMGLSRFVEPAMKCFPARAGEFEGAVGKLYSAHEGRLGIKWDHYFRVYDRDRMKRREFIAGLGSAGV